MPSAIVAYSAPFCLAQSLAGLRGLISSDHSPAPCNICPVPCKTPDLNAGISSCFFASSASAWVVKSKSGCSPLASARASSSVMLSGMKSV